MWHEARRQEKKVREVMVNLQRRAERRKEHYEKLVSFSGILNVVSCCIDCMLSLAVGSK